MPAGKNCRKVGSGRSKKRIPAGGDERKSSESKAATPRPPSRPPPITPCFHRPAMKRAQRRAFPRPPQHDCLRPPAVSPFSITPRQTRDSPSCGSNRRTIPIEFQRVPVRPTPTASHGQGTPPPMDRGDERRAPFSSRSKLIIAIFLWRLLWPYAVLLARSAGVSFRQGSFSGRQNTAIPLGNPALFTTFLWPSSWAASFSPGPTFPCGIPIRIAAGPSTRS